MCYVVMYCKIKNSYNFKKENDIETTAEVVRNDGLLLPTDEEIKVFLKSAKGMLATYEDACLANAEMLP